MFYVVPGKKKKKKRNLRCRNNKQRAIKAASTLCSQDVYSIIGTAQSLQNLVVCILHISP